MKSVWNGTIATSDARSHSWRLWRRRAHGCITYSKTLVIRSYTEKAHRATEIWNPFFTKTLEEIRHNLWRVSGPRYFPCRFKHTEVVIASKKLKATTVNNYRLYWKFQGNYLKTDKWQTLTRSGEQYYPPGVWWTIWLSKSLYSL